MFMYAIDFLELNGDVKLMKKRHFKALPLRAERRLNSPSGASNGCDYRGRRRFF
jgi:hypothetical protein